MNKTRITRFIQKYSLGGLVESVAWKAGDNKLTTRFISDDKTVLGEVELDNFSFELGEIKKKDKIVDKIDNNQRIIGYSIRVSLISNLNYRLLLINLIIDNFCSSYNIYIYENYFRFSKTC